MRLKSQKKFCNRTGGNLYMIECKKQIAQLYGFYEIQIKDDDIMHAFYNSVKFII